MASRSTASAVIVASSSGAEPKLPRGNGWWVYSRKDRNGRALVLRYRENGKWRDHRIPADIRGKRKQLEEYANTFVAALAERRRLAERESASPTFQEFAQHWTSGRLAKEFPDQVRTKRSATHDEGRLARYAYPVCGSVPIADVTLADAERIMAALPEDLQQQTRRNIAKAVSRVLSLAVYPAKLRDSNPIPRGFMPPTGGRKAELWLWPEEEAQLIGSPAVPLENRVLYALLAREGMRLSEATGLDWRHVDLVRGTVSLDKNKTDDPRIWVLDPSVCRALRIYRERYRDGAGQDTPVFCDSRGSRFDYGDEISAELFRTHLMAAGIDRAELYPIPGQRRRAGSVDGKPGQRVESVRIPIRIHDLRATFVTVALAVDRSERWVKDRTGHRSSHMLDRYRRAARTVAELGCHWFDPMDLAIPEFRCGNAEGLWSDVAHDVARENDAGWHSGEMGLVPAAMRDCTDSNLLGLLDPDSEPRASQKCRTV